MVELFYYENRGACCKKLLTKAGYPTRILLFPYDGWACSAMHIYWTVKTNRWWNKWWNKSRYNVKVVETCAGKKFSTKARIQECSNGVIRISGHFDDSNGLHNGMPDFELVMTSYVTKPDFRSGYLLTGTLERGNRKFGNMEFTHFAMVKRYFSK